MTSGWQDGLNITHDPGGANNNLVDDFIAFPSLTDVVTEEVRHCILILAAVDGKYITKAPIIDEFDKIRISHTDEFGNVYNHVFEVDKMIPRQKKREGTKLELHLLGIERNVQDIQYTKPHFNEHAKNVSIDILDYYNQQTGTTQPQVTDYEGTDNELPNYVLNNYEFGLNEDSCFDRLNEVVDKLGASADAGGVFDFFETRFDSDAGDENLLHFKAFSSGSKPASPITIEDINETNVGESEAGIESKKGTIVIKWGGVGEGSLPTNFTRYNGEVEAFALHPPFDSTAPYLIGHKVIFQDTSQVTRHYERITTDSSPPSSDPDVDANWKEVTENSLFGDTDSDNPITYSPWTRTGASPDDQAFIWIKNSGANHDNLGNATTEPFGESFFDGNLVVWDDAPDNESFRSWAHVRAENGSQIDVDYLFAATTGPTGESRGLRVLVDNQLGAGVGSPWTLNSGKDENGKVFKNSVVTHLGTKFTGGNEYKNWRVLYEANSAAQDGMMCAIRDEGRVYKFDFNAVPDQWINEAGTAFANDCFHRYDSVEADGGILSTSDGDTSQSANTKSAIKVVYSHQSIIPFLTQLAGLANKSNYYQAGCWFNLTFPYPENTSRSIPEEVGEVYGGGEQGTTVKEPATLDTQNMHFTHNGLRGFNHGLDSSDYGQLSSLDFFIKHRITHSLIGVLLKADLKWRVIAGDTLDNVVFQDFTIPHNGVNEAVSLPLAGFGVYRGRRPLQNEFESLVPPKALSPANKFFWRNLKWMVIQWQEPYDGDGRYKPWIPDTNTLLLGLGGTITHTLHIDALRFSKPLLAVTDKITDKVITQQGSESPTTINYVQLIQDAKAELEKQKFRRRQYDIVTSGRYDIKPGESFFIKNPETVPTTDDGGTANTIKLVAKRIEYSITKPRRGSGGFIRTIQGVRRLET